MTDEDIRVTARTTWSDMAVVGTVARAHGRRGQVIVNPSTDFPEARFQAGNTMYAIVGDAPVALRITEARFQRGRPVLELDGIATMDEAEQLRGGELRVPEARLSPLPSDVYYLHDLVGCAVRTLGGEDVGVVSDVQGPEGAQRLIVTRGRREVDVPLAEEICVSIDLPARDIRIDPPAGLLELNRAKVRGPGALG